MAKVDNKHTIFASHRPTHLIAPISNLLSVERLNILSNKCCSLVSSMLRVLILFHVFLLERSYGFAPIPTDVKYSSAHNQHRSRRLFLVQDVSQLGDSEMKTYADYSKLLHSVDHILSIMPLMIYSAGVLTWR